ncbi:twin-arginine translocation signal domain-containing protein [Nocardioides panacisoli]|uniref:Twin-arginine translocation signal domain-containing protein n=1 Tax=Nocardioides panacisoli TaxID=627624 RepID=A0ABP7IYV4_9ACTN
MSETNRRKFLAAAGIGTAAGTVGLVAGGSPARATPHPERAKEPLLALVEDHRGSEVRLLVGEREVVVQDRDLVTRLLNAAGGR